MNTKLTIAEETECNDLAGELEQVAEEVRARGMKGKERKGVSDALERLLPLVDRLKSVAYERVH